MKKGKRLTSDFYSFLCIQHVHATQRQEREDNMEKAPSQLLLLSGTRKAISFYSTFFIVVFSYKFFFFPSPLLPPFLLCSPYLLIGIIYTI